MSQMEELSWDQARTAAYKVSAPTEIESVGLADAVNRVTAIDIAALCDLPTFETSAMDGWVVAGQGPWTIVGDIKAGAPWSGTMQPGQTLRIATGAVIPAGALGVLRWERATQRDNLISGEVVAGQDIRPAGLECRAGEKIIDAGTWLSPTHIGLLAAMGYDDVQVRRTPRAAVLLLGDELLLSGLPKDGQVRDALGIQIPALVSKIGAQVEHREYVIDELDSTLNALEDAVQKYDAVFTTGGTADGPRDHLHSALDRLGATYIVDRVKARPGHPMLLATIPVPGRDKTVPLVGLPGNPQSAVVGLLTLGQSVIQGTLGQPLPELETVTTTTDLEVQPDFHRLIAGSVRENRFTPANHLGSAMLRGLAGSMGFAVAGPGSMQTGSSVRWLPMP